MTTTRVDGQVLRPRRHRRDREGDDRHEAVDTDKKCNKNKDTKMVSRNHIASIQIRNRYYICCDPSSLG